MTREELEVELICYKATFNKGCDLNNLTKDDILEFLNLYLELKENEEEIEKELEPIYSIFSGVKTPEDFKEIMSKYKNNPSLLKFL